MQTRKALKALSKGDQVRDFVSDSGPLAANAEKITQRHAQRMAEVAEAQQRHNFAAALPVLQAARSKLESMMGSQVLPDDVPIATRFEAFSVLKDASRKLDGDLGVKRFATHLERLWHEDPMGTLSAGAMTRLRDYYQQQVPSSRVGEVVDQVVPKISFNSLPVAKLVQAAANIQSQEDYDQAMSRLCLTGDDLRSIRARTFVRELVNRTAQLDPSKTEEQRLFPISTGQKPYIADSADKHCDKHGAADCSACMTPGRTGSARRKQNASRVVDSMIQRLEKTAQMPAPLSPTQSPNTMQSPGMTEQDGTMPDGAMPGTTGPGPTPTSSGGSPPGSGITQMGGGPAGVPNPSAPPGTAPTQPGVLAEDRSQKLNMGVNGTGLMPIAMKEQAAMYAHAAATGNGISKTASVPKEWESTVKEMKTNKEIDNPFALVNWMEQQGYTPGGKKKSDVDTKLEAWKGIDKTADKGPDQPEFKPEVNEQQDDKVKKVPEDGGKAIKAFAIPSDHPLVDDGADHLPIAIAAHRESVRKFIAGLKDSPDWWLGSIDELKKLVLATIPAEQPKAVVKVATKPKKVEIKAAEVEKALLAGKTWKRGSYSIVVADDYTVRIKSRTGERKYAMAEMDGAIADLIYLASSEIISEPPPPMFMMREGFRLTCPGCNQINSYPMPKEASGVSCVHCNVVLPPRVVQAAFEHGVATDEVTLVAYIPVSTQEKFGDEFAKAAEMVGADDIGAHGCCAEAYSISFDDNKLADAWDTLVKAGFKPIAQNMTPPMGEDMPTMDAMPPEMPAEMPMPGAEGEDAPQPGSGQWADWQVIQAAMIHYQHQGMNVVSAIAEFKKDYGDDYDPQLVMQVANSVYQTQTAPGMTPEMPEGEAGAAGEMPAEPVLAGRKNADLPSTKVNPQQPDAVQPEKLGPDSETRGDLPSVKVKQQAKPQGTMSDTGTEPDTDNRDPGNFGSERPKTNHLPKDQRGVKLPATGLGPDSDTRGSIPTASRRFLNKLAQVTPQSHERAKQVVQETLINEQLKQYVSQMSDDFWSQNQDAFQQMLDMNANEQQLQTYAMAYAIATVPAVAAQVEKMMSKAAERQPMAAAV